MFELRRIIGGLYGDKSDVGREQEHQKISNNTHEILRFASAYSVSYTLKNSTIQDIKDPKRVKIKVDLTVIYINLYGMKSFRTEEYGDSVQRGRKY